jgi:hypothetical protein
MSYRPATPHELATARAYRIPYRGYLVQTPVGWLALPLPAGPTPIGRTWTYSRAIAWAADQVAAGEPTHDSRAEAAAALAG